MSPVALVRTAKIGEPGPCACVMKTRSWATTGAGTGMSPPPFRLHTSRPVFAS